MSSVAQKEVTDTTQAKPVKPAAKDFGVKIIPLSKISDVSINVRFANNLDIATMKDELAAKGRVTDAITLWLPAENVAKQLSVKPGEYVVIRGNRRTIASKEILSEPDQWSAALVDSLQKIPAIVHDNLTLTEAEEMVLDHNSMKRIAKSEIVQSVFRRYLGNKAEMDIILEMHRIIGEDLVGKADKVKELEKIHDPKKRRDFARKWLHTFVGNYLIRACKLGPFIREQVLFHFKQGDGLLEDNEIVHFKGNTSAIQALSTAKTEDDKDGSWESGVTGITVNGEGIKVTGGGNATKQAVIDLINSHKNGKKTKKDDETRPLSKKELEDRKDSFQSVTVVNALRMALGYEVPNLADEDVKAYRRATVENVLREYADKIKVAPEVVALLKQVIDSNVNVTKIVETCRELSK